MAEAPVLRVTLPRYRFLALLQRGVGIADGVGTTVRAFLEGILGVDPAYVESRLRTVFLDGHPVDDLDGAVLGAGAVLALSGAMPGLAGASMRRGGYYARLREGITHDETSTSDGSRREELVVLKLFNRPLEDLADALAGRPLLAPSDALDGLDGLDPGAAEGGWVLLAVTVA